MFRTQCVLTDAEWERRSADTLSADADRALAVAEENKAAAEAGISPRIVALANKAAKLHGDDRQKRKSKKPEPMNVYFMRVLNEDQTTATTEILQQMGKVTGHRGPKKLAWLKSHGLLPAKEVVPGVKAKPEPATPSFSQLPLPGRNHHI